MNWPFFAVVIWPPSIFRGGGGPLVKSRASGRRRDDGGGGGDLMRADAADNTQRERGRTGHTNAALPPPSLSNWIDRYALMTHNVTALRERVIGGAIGGAKKHVPPPHDRPAVITYARVEEANKCGGLPSPPDSCANDDEARRGAVGGGALSHTPPLFFFCYSQSAVVVVVVASATNKTNNVYSRAPPYHKPDSRDASSQASERTNEREREREK